MLSVQIFANNILSLSGLRRILRGTPFFCCASSRERLELIKSLRDEGKTLQEIADMLGYKSRSTVMNLLKKAE